MKITIVTPTHEPRWLEEGFRSLVEQENAPRWEWLLSPNTEQALVVATRLAREHRDLIRVAPNLNPPSRNVGALKRAAFSEATGDVVLELDHDDLLAPRALSHVADAMSDESVDFVYSDCVDFPAPCTYHDPQTRAAWEGDGWKFGTAPGGTTDYPLSWEPSALAMSTIHYAPNHLRAWRRQFYDRIGGHSDLWVCDDHELLIRTYLNGTMKRIPLPLYRYRVHGANTWLERNQAIQQTSAELKHKYLHRLVEREMQVRGLPCFDLGGAKGAAGNPWIAVDVKFRDTLPPGETMCVYLPEQTDFLASLNPNVRRVETDLRKRWPFPDGSVGAFRAFDFLEHLPDKMHTMSEIYRCLAPGGWLLSSTPSALGQGAFQDPTHCSYWVPNSFRYYTEQRLAQYIDNVRERFMEVRCFQTDDAIPYVIADLVSLKEDDGHLPGQRRI